MKKRKQRKTDEISFWQPSSDMMTALILVLLLVILLLILYLMRIPNRDFIGYFDREAETETEYEPREEEERQSERQTERQTEKREEVDNGGNGNGDGDDDGDYPETEEGEYPYKEEGVKSAVYVMLVDGETDKTVKEEGVTFELRDSDKKLQVLNTYYPVRITYRDYETTEDGTFYLPEKIYQGRYFLRDLTEAQGYDLAEDTWFDLDDLYDWPAPFVVKVPVFPSRNTIKIRMTDEDTGEAVPGAVFEITASEDIVTADGTFRYGAGETVGTIVCDENGYGESEELYLGNYVLKETGIPQYYASAASPVKCEVEKKTGDEEEPETVENEKTKITFTLTDEQTREPVEGAVFSVSGGETSEEYTTDTDGKITIDALDKDTAYTFTQVSAPGDYIMTEEKPSAKVSARGRFGTKAETELEAVNRMIRVRINAVDAVLKKPLSDTALTLHSEDGDVLDTWTASGVAKSYTDLKPGDYYLTVGEDDEKHFPFTVEDTAQVQDRNMAVWTVRSYLVLAGLALAVTAVLFGLWKLIGKLLRKNR